MSGLRIGIDVGGTFTHGVLLEPPGSVLASARVPTTHRATAGVAEGIGQVLALLLERLPGLGRSKDEIELVAHSTTQATNALLEGDLSGVHLVALYPPGEREAVASALAPRLLPLGGGHFVKVWPKLLCEWATATTAEYPAEPGERRSSDRQFSPERSERSIAPEEGDAGLKTSAPLSSLPAPDWARRDGVADGWDSKDGVPPGFWVSERLPVAIVQPLAGRHELREPVVAAHYRAHGHSVVCAGEITQVLGLAARARTAIVNAAMLPTMLATANHTERSVRKLLPGAAASMPPKETGASDGAAPNANHGASDGAAPGGVALQVVRSDGGAMSIDEMRRQPINALLSGPAAGASAALHRSGLSDFVFIEVGGTSTDITIVSDGRVRQRSAEVGGQRLLVPALELRTVAVGGGSMLRADASLFGPRSAHIAGLPYLFQALQAGLTVRGIEPWREDSDGPDFLTARISDGSHAALTLTEYQLALGDSEAAQALFGLELDEQIVAAIRAVMDKPEIHKAFEQTVAIVLREIQSLARAQKLDLSRFQLVGGGGGAPAISQAVGGALGLRSSLIADHTVISAIGAALAVTCVSLSRTVADPKASDIAELSEQVAARLRAQGSERVSTDYDYDPQRQVLTVTGRGNRPYAQDAQPHSDAQLAALAAELLAGSADTRVRNGAGTEKEADTSVRGPGQDAGLKTSAPEEGGSSSAPTGSGAVAGADLLWSGGGMQLWQAHSGADQRFGPPGRHAVGRPGSASAGRGGGLFGGGRSRGGAAALALEHFGRVLWQGALSAHYPARGAQRESVLAQILARHTAWGDGGSELPGLALLAAGRLIPLEHLGSAELIAEVLRLEQLAADEQCCFIVRG